MHLIGRALTRLPLRQCLLDISSTDDNRCTHSVRLPTKAPDFLPSAMKTGTTVALLMLACSCSSGSAKTRPAFHSVLHTFLVGSLSEYQSMVEPFQPDEDMKDAGTKMKTLVDTLPQSTRQAVLRL
ncbi:uteroglobin isoform X1 [Fukomys damarensis]|uniref:uteroglobin isoform X1 n=1 Tax=Fukomys damarensis TaxID=885580 RepID=UPI00053FFAAA|nr:uteroglobin isoform X1 [Fukomys damarensis]XP_033612419.1 uteroglobin isoform X1 [Fukomys damarensis]